MRCRILHPIPDGYEPEIGKRMPLKLEFREEVGDAEIVGVSPDGMSLLIDIELDERASSQLLDAIGGHLDQHEFSLGEVPE